MDSSSAQSAFIRFCSITLSGVAMTVLMAAGLLKAVDVPQFASAIETWKIIPATFAWPLAIVVVAMEIGLSFAWFLNLRRRLVSVVALLLLATFTTAFLIESYLAEPPDCACLGAWAEFRMTENAVIAQLTQNSALIGLLGLGLLVPVVGRNVEKKKRQRRDEVTTSPAEHQTMRTGATIVETLVVILVVSLLLALALGPLRKVRDTGNHVLSVANLKTHLSNITMYSIDFDDSFPMFMDTRNPRTTLPHNGSTINIRYFEQPDFWTIPMRSLYYDGLWPHPSQIRPGEQLQWNSYLLSSTTMASPAFWNLETRTGPEQRRATRVAEVSFTSKKAIFTELWIESYPAPHGVNRGTIRLGLADGSADGFSKAKLSDPVRSGEGEYPGWFRNHGLYGMHTVDGLRGIDVK